jgi:hypothetical protein
MVLTVVYNTQSRWVYGLCPSSGYLFSYLIAWRLKMSVSPVRSEEPTNVVYVK